MKVEQNFNEFVAKEVISALNYITGVFTMVTSMCEYDEDDDEVTRMEGSPSANLITKAADETLPVPRGLFALSFEKIPCNEPIKPCQFRTGRRYIQPDNFPSDDDLDHYLGLMNKISSRKTQLKSDESTLSFDLASEDHLQFQLLSEQFVEIFPTLDDNMLQALKSYYPLQVEFLQSEGIDEVSIQVYFSLPNGEEDIKTLEEMCYYIRALAEDAKDLATKVPQITPEEYQDFFVELNDFDNADVRLPVLCL